jgi:hemerythrin
MSDQHVNSSTSRDSSAGDASFSEIRYRRHRIIWDVRRQRGTQYWTGKAAVVSLSTGSILRRIETIKGDLSYTTAEKTRRYLLSAAKTWIDNQITEHPSAESEYGAIVLWKDSFSVGIRKIDKQHQELINIMNSLIGNEDANGSSERIASVLERMTRYAHYHFETEETLMREYQYPDFESHRADHVQFKMKTAEFCSDASNGEETLPDEVVAYLRHWLTHHILRTDMKYKPYFLQRGVL